MTPTPTRTPWPITGFSENEQYQVFDYCCEISGATAEVPYPNPIYTDGEGVPFSQKNAVELGGFNGLNN
jgi:hypothetical protein